MSTPQSKPRANQYTIIAFFLIAIVVADICFELIKSCLDYVFDTSKGHPLQWLLVVIGAFIVLWAFSKYVVKLPLVEAFNPSTAIEKEVEPS